MPRRMSLQSRARIDELLKVNPKAIGPKLGNVSVKYNIPARAFADAVRVSEPTVYRWFYGDAEPRPMHMTRIRKLMSIFRAAHAAGDIPLVGTFEQRMQAVRDVIKKHKPYAGP